MHFFCPPHEGHYLINYMNITFINHDYRTEIIITFEAVVY